MILRNNVGKPARVKGNLQCSVQVCVLSRQEGPTGESVSENCPRNLKQGSSWNQKHAVLTWGSAGSDACRDTKSGCTKTPAGNGHLDNGPNRECFLPRVCNKLHNGTVYF